MVEGTEELLANIKKLQVNNRKQARKALNEGAKELEKTLARNTPKDSGQLASDITKSGLKGSGQGEMEIDVGFGKAHGWRAHFPDTGTVYQRAQNFSERSTEEARGKVQEIYAKHIKEGLEL